MILLSVVIPCLNEVEHIDLALRSLLASNDPGVPWEVIVADGGSQDGTRGKLEEWRDRDPRVRWVDNPERVTPNGLNHGIRASQGQAVIILGAHSAVNTDFLVRNYESFLAHPESGCVGGLVEQVHGSEKSRRIGAALSSPFGVGDARFRTGGLPSHVDTVAFGCYRREALDEVGLFDEQLVRNQDDELNFRLTKAGWRIWFDPRIKSSYFVRSSFSKLYRQYAQYGYWKVLVNRMHRTVTTWRQVVPAFFLLGLATTTGAWALDEAGFLPEPWSGLPSSLALSIVALWLAGGAIAASAVAPTGRDIPGILWAFAVVHVAYGWGYWKGIFRFLLLAQSPSGRSQHLTR